MGRWKIAAGAGALALAIVGAAALAQDKPGASGRPAWAFPGPTTETLPGSTAHYSTVQIYDRTQAVDWFPNSHPPMPPSVAGRAAPYACGFCHLPQGAGRSENASLAGLPYDYIMQQVADMKSGARKLVDPAFGPGANMIQSIKLVPDADAQAAAKYYASLKYAKHLKLIEAQDIPRHSDDAFVYVFDKSGAREPLGERIVEGPDDFERFEKRDPTMTFTAYVPVGAVARGAALAKGDGGAKLACDSCHGEGLKGGPIGPPIAGRLPTGLFRQLYAFQTGARARAGAALMKPVVTGLSHKEMIELAAYVSSLEP